MCGFLFSCSLAGPIVPPVSLIELLKRRGPDSLNIVHRSINPRTSSVEVPYKKLHLLFVASVLSLRGKKLIPQPLVDGDTGSLFVWNGEAWSINGQAIGGNDAEHVFQSLLSFARELHWNTFESSANIISARDAVKKVIGTIRGPFSYLFYDAMTNHIFYGRDRLGRRSLLQKGEAAYELSISSVSDGLPYVPWIEVDSSGIHSLNLDSSHHFSDAVNKTKIGEPSAFRGNCIPWAGFTVWLLLPINLGSETRSLEAV